MQIVIDIPTKEYNNIIKGRWEGNLLADYIENGTPLPKGHGRLVDADKTILKICGTSCGCHLEECGRDKPCFSVARIESALTIIEADMESEE